MNSIKKILADLLGPPTNPNRQEIEGLVVACYTLLLKRTPSGDEIEAQVRSYAGPGQLMSIFVNSEEYSRKLGAKFTSDLDEMYAAPAQQIDVTMTDAQRAAMFARIRSEWTRLGEEDPYWSVITEEKYKKDRLDQVALEDFFASGEAAVKNLQNFAARNGESLPPGVCLELGCGAGRVTKHLAKAFDHVIAVDVSAGNMALCKENLVRAGINNVSFALVSDPEEFRSFGRIDFFFSTIVLQHNPPPLQHFILDSVLASLNAGGGAFFQIPTHTPSYAFDCESYLKSAAPVMEMHTLPMRHVFGLLHKHGLQPSEVLMDTLTGVFGSHSFLAFKR